MLGKLGARNDAAGVVDEKSQQPLLEGGQPDRQAIEGDEAHLGIERKGTAVEHRRGMAGGAADERAQADDDFLGAEGLGEIIIGPGAKAADLFGPFLARR